MHDDVVDAWLIAYEDHLIIDVIDRVRDREADIKSFKLINKFNLFNGI